MKPRIPRMPIFIALAAFIAISSGFSIPMAAPVLNGSITGKINASGLRNASNALVYIATAPGQFSPQGSPVMDQRGISFEPHVLPIVAGTAVTFYNSDDVQHNVFTPSPAGEFFNLGTWGRGQSQKRTFTKMGKVDLLCNIHHEMRGYVLVLQNPYFAVTDAAGNYRINNVPPGSYQLKIWHERATGQPQAIQVAGGTVTVNFTLAAI